MEIVELSSLAVSAVSTFAAWSLWIRRKGYETGYAHGRHAGFSEGLFKAAERANRRLTKQYAGV
jgi:flagellar biosynthesis/type III secretory pathway protein FliH